MNLCALCYTQLFYQHGNIHQFANARVCFSDISIIFLSLFGDFLLSALRKNLPDNKKNEPDQKKWRQSERV